MTRFISSAIGDLSLTVTYELRGEHLFATTANPEEWPEIELCRLAAPSGEDVSGLLAFDPVYERLLEDVTEYERDRDDVDSDEAYDRWRDAQLETA